MSKKKKSSQLYMPYSSLIFNNEERRRQHIMRLDASGYRDESRVAQHLQETSDNSPQKTIDSYVRSRTLVKTNPMDASKKKNLSEMSDKQYVQRVTRDFFEIDAPEKYGFEVREGQQDMAREVAEAVTYSKHLIVEAGVGIGKSFAYLVPLLLYNQRTAIPVIVATSTIALQEQLLKDVRRLQKYLGMRQEVVVAKGQSHYVCRDRAQKFFATTKSSKILKQIEKSIDDGCSERQKFLFPISSDIWNQICVENYNMRTCSSCTYECPYKSIRAKLIETNGIIICNQDFLTVHLYIVSRGMRPLITPRAAVAVVDEAHDLESKVRSVTTKRFESKKLVRLMKDARSELHVSDRQYLAKPIEDTRMSIGIFFEMLQNQVKQQVMTSEHDMKHADKFFFDPKVDVLCIFRKMIREISEVGEMVQLLIGRANERNNREFRASNELDQVVLSLNELSANMNENLIWIEQNGNTTEFVCCPKDIKAIMRSLYFEKKAHNFATILTSATLTNNGQGTLEEQYSYFISNTGFPTGKHGVLSVPKQSPFPYDKHAMIYYCDDLPHPTKQRDEFFERGVERLIQILRITDGKALVLFTAKSDMEEVYKRLTDEKLPYKILLQQSGSSQEMVLSEFKENVNSVLLGTGAYWEGISIEGQPLSSVIIFRLPFPVPDPVIDYKSSIVEDPLMEVAVPEMITKLRQGIGRLIRNFTDTGIVSIIDCRLRNDPPERYHDIVWNALPIRNRTNDLRKLKVFYKKVCVIPNDNKGEVQ